MQIDTLLKEELTPALLNRLVWESFAAIQHGELTFDVFTDTFLDNIPEDLHEVAVSEFFRLKAAYFAMLSDAYQQVGELTGVSLPVNRKEFTPKTAAALATIASKEYESAVWLALYKGREHHAREIILALLEPTAS
jgi:hypothetical protein